MLPLLAPVAGGSIEALENFLNTKTEPNFVLAVTWILQALHGKGPFAIEALVGEQGTAKSTFSWCQRALVDPNCVPLRSLPRDDRDLFITATNSHVLAFDNVSGLQPWLSDALCRIASGGGFSTRQLYTDADEVLFDAQRPIVLNGIEDIINPSGSRRPSDTPDVVANPRGEAEVRGTTKSRIRGCPARHSRSTA